MVTILLEQILDLLKGWLTSFTTWAEGVATTLGLIEEQTEYIDDIYDDTEAIKTDTGNIATSNQLIVSNTQGINNRLQSIDPNVTAIKNNVGTISTNTGIAAAFSEDIATNTMNTLDKVTTIASDTTQLRADNAVVKSDLDKIYDALKWSLVGIDTTETEEGIGSVSFDTDKTDTLDQFDIAFSSVQEGSGDPTPNNIRNISYWTDFNISANGSLYNLNLNGKYCDGVVNALTGDIACSSKYIDMSLLSINNIVRDSNSWRINFSAAFYSERYRIGECNMLTFKNNYNSVNGTNYSIAFNNSTGDQILLRNDDLSTSTDVQNFINTLICKYPETITGTASNTLSINTIKGLNTITSDSNGTMTVTYTESVKHYLDKQEG